MNVRSLVPVLLVLLCCEAAIAQTPKVLQSKDYTLSNKKGSWDLVSNMFTELTEKNADLKALDEQVSWLYRNLPDSTILFENFIATNRAYYAAADNLTSQIKDSTVRKALELLIQQSKTQLAKKIATHKELRTQIEKSVDALNDQVFALKISRTLPLMEQYQDNNAALKPPMENILKELENANHSIGNILKAKQ